MGLFGQLKILVKTQKTDSIACTFYTETTKFWIDLKFVSSGKNAWVPKSKSISVANW